MKVAASDVELLEMHFNRLDKGQREKAKLLLRRKKTGVLNKYITDRHTPTHKQEMILSCDDKEVLIGGAAGGSKSWTLWMGALQYVTEPEYAALILRNTYKQLVKPGALISVAREWMAPWINSGEVRWDNELYAYRFPSGATVGFGYLDSDGDKYNYQGSNYHFCAFDELTQFPIESYQYLFSRLRRATDDRIPIRMRSSSNPGGEHGEWVKERFIPDEYSICPKCGMHLGTSYDRERQGKQCCIDFAESRFRRVWYKETVEGRRVVRRTFIPANLKDNPYLDVETYRESLRELGPAVREQLEYGDWDVLEQGDYFRTEWFKYYTMRADHWILPNADTGGFIAIPPHGIEYFLTVDTASSQKADSAYTVICVWALDIKQFNLMLVDVIRNKFLVPDIAPEVAKQAARYNVKFAMIESKDSGMGVIQQLRIKQGLTIRDFNPQSHKGYNGATDKISRSTVAQNRMQSGMVWFPRTAPFLHGFQSELLAFPTGEYADQVDNMSMAAIYVDERAKYGKGGELPKPMMASKPVYSGYKMPGRM